MKKLLNSFLMIIILLLMGCSEKDSSSYEVQLNFKFMANGELIDINAPSSHTNLEGQDYTVSKIQMLISDVFLTTNSGFLQNKHTEDEISPDDKRVTEYHFLDIADSNTLTVSNKNFDKSDGVYTYLTFRFGLDEESNVTNSLPNETSFNDFAWPPQMGGGYHYMKFEGTEDVTPGSFAMHAGPTGGTDFSFVVTLPVSQRVKDNKLILNVIVDMNQFFSSDFNFPIAGIMGNSSAQEFIQANGPEVFSLE